MCKQLKLFSFLNELIDEPANSYSALMVLWTLAGIYRCLDGKPSRQRAFPSLSDGYISFYLIPIECFISFHFLNELIVEPTKPFIF